MKRIFRSGRYANVTATLALVAALGGTSYAAITLPKNSVGSKQIKSNAVTSSKVKNGSLVSKDFKPGQLPAGSAGPTGPTGPKGETGAAGQNLTAQSPLPSGKSESGFFAAGGGTSTGGYIADNVHFTQPLSAPITAAGHVVYNLTGVTTANCPGAGQAAAGYLCFYVNETNQVSLCCIYDFALDDPAIDRSGGIIYWNVLASGSYASGSWTVTAA